MMNNNDLLQKCCELIEQKLNWGSSIEWQNKDFEVLSTQIYDQTNVVLSISTLKRVWGKIKYESFPALTTLNALAVFAGYSSWRDFTQQQSGPAATETPLNEPKKQEHKFAWYIIPLLLVTLIAAGWMYKMNTTGKTAPSSSFVFSSQPLAKGIPNSVIFNYNAAAAGDDSVFIQQSWDPKRRSPVSTKSNTYTSIYYYPGFFKAKLIVGNKIVKEHDLLIPSNGWLAAVDHQPVPVYFSKKELPATGTLQIPIELIKSRNIPLQPQIPEIRFYNIGDFKGLRNDNFNFETGLKSDYNEGSAACQRARIIIHCESTAIIIPLGIPGCVGETSLLLPGKEISAKEADLSGFGCDMSNWVKIRVEARNKQIQIWVNGKKAYSDSFTEEANRIVGVSYRFEGPGSLNAVKFTRTDGSVVFDDAF